MKSFVVFSAFAVAFAFLAGCTAFASSGGAPAAVSASSSAPQSQPQTGSTAQPLPPAQASSAQPQAASALQCAAPAPLTPDQTEGPYFKSGSPERAALVQAGMKGTGLVLSGYVLTTDCKPIAHALLDFWQADSGGNYDNTGFTLRGHQFTDASGRYELTTIIPGLYPGRTEHIHVKVQAPNRPILTTQLYFPGIASNQRDGIFDAKLLMTIQDAANGKAATFNFVVK